jgi:hypothetical protein
VIDHLYFHFPSQHQTQKQSKSTMSTNCQAHVVNPPLQSPPSLDDTEILRLASRGVVTAAATEAIKSASIATFLSASQMVT